MQGDVGIAFVVAMLTYLIVIVVSLFCAALISGLFKFIKSRRKTTESHTTQVF